MTQRLTIEILDNYCAFSNLIPQIEAFQLPMERCPQGTRLSGIYDKRQSRIASDCACFET